MKKYYQKNKEHLKEYMKRYGKEYYQRPEVIKKGKEYYQRPEVIARRIATSKKPERLATKKIYQQEYWKRIKDIPEVKGKRKEYGKKNKKIYERTRKRNDKEYHLLSKLRTSLGKALQKYSKTGKIMSSKKYGINWKEIIEHLKPFPKDRKNYHVDHIIPLTMFDFNDPEQVKKAFMPHNLQWLTAFENISKGNKLIMPRMKGGKEK